MIGDWTEIIRLFLTSWVLNSWISTMLWSRSGGFLFKKVGKFISLVLICPKCFSFWFTLIMTFNPLLAAAVSYLIMWSDKLEQSIKTKL